jgi:hypothetical protein
MHLKRVKWLLEHRDLWVGRDTYTIFGILQKHGLYSLKSVKKDCSMTIEKMLELIKVLDKKGLE